MSPPAYFTDCATIIPVTSSEEKIQNNLLNLQHVTPPIFIHTDTSGNNQHESKATIHNDPETVVCDYDTDCSSNSDDDEGDEVSEAHSQAGIWRTGESLDSSTTLPPEKSKKSFWRKYRGMMLAIASSLIFSVSALLVKKLDRFDPFNSALYKFQAALIFAIPLLLQKRYCKPTVVENVWPLTEKKKLTALLLVLLRSFLTCNALLLHLYSLKYLPSMGDALVISSASPIFVSILAKIFLGEKCGYATIIASLFSLVGVVAIAKPPILSGSESFNADIMIGSGLAFACTLVTATSYIVLRYIRKVHYSVTMLMYGAWGSLENLVIVLIIPGLIIPNSPTEWALIGGLAALTILGQIAIILAMKAEHAGPVALVRTFDVLFAFLLEIAVWKRLPDLWSLLGAAIIVLAVIYIGLRKWVRSYPRGHPIRIKLRFIAF